MGSTTLYKDTITAPLFQSRAREPLDDLKPEPLLIRFCEDIWKPTIREQTWLRDTICKYGIKSVPEQLFLAAWAHSRPTVALHPQYHIGDHFTDFMVDPLSHFNLDPLFPKERLLTPFVTEGIPRYAVEIDSKTHHDQTQEQVELSRYRERYMQREGFYVIRFAAREVNRDPQEYVAELQDRITRDIRTIYSRLRPRQEV